MKKKAVFLLTAAFMAGSLSACGSNSGQETQAAQRQEAAAGAQEQKEDTSDSIELVFAWWGNQVRNERTQAILNMYSEENPGVAFDGQFSEVADYWKKIATAAAGHTMPDIMQMDYKYLQQYVDSNLVIDLKPYIDNGAIHVEDCNEDVLNSAQVNDGIYAICNGINAPMLAYNKTALDQAGIEVKDNMNMEEFYALCKEVHEKTGYKTNIAYNNDDNYIEYFLRGKGVIMFDDGKMGGTADDYTDFFKIYEKGREEGWLIDASVFAERTIGAMEQDCMVYGSSPDTMSWCAFVYTNSMSSLENVAPEGVEIGITTWPSDDPVKSNYLKPSQFFSITIDSKNPDECAKVIDYITNSVECNNVLLGERGIPLSAKVAEAIAPNMGESNQKVIRFINEVVSPNSSKVNPPAGNGASEVNDMLNKLEEKVCYGQMTAEEAGQQLFTEGCEILSSKK